MVSSLLGRPRHFSLLNTTGIQAVIAQLAPKTYSVRKGSLSQSVLVAPTTRARVPQNRERLQEGRGGLWGTLNTRRLEVGIKETRTSGLVAWLCRRRWRRASCGVDHAFQLLEDRGIFKDEMPALPTKTFNKEIQCHNTFRLSIRGCSLVISSPEGLSGRRKRTRVLRGRAV